MTPDCHAHLDLIDREPAEVVSGARSCGVSPIITIGITLDSSLNAVRLAGNHEHVYASVGIHPNDTADLSADDFDRLEEIARSSARVVAIGETGLDYYRDRSPVDAQKRAFRAQVALARKLDKALIVHDRQAHGDALEILAEEKAGETRVVMHCFSGDKAMLKECEKRGYFISFAGPITFKKSTDTRAVASIAPLDRLLCETDAPFLSPEPFRGKPNFPERVRYVADELARVRGLIPEEMESVLAANTRGAFGVEAVEA